MFKLTLYWWTVLFVCICDLYAVLAHRLEKSKYLYKIAHSLFIRTVNFTLNIYCSAYGLSGIYKRLSFACVWNDVLLISVWNKFCYIIIIKLYSSQRPVFVIVIIIVYNCKSYLNVVHLHRLYITLCVCVCVSLLCGGRLMILNE